MSEPIISVVVPCFNGEAMLEGCLRGIDAQGVACEIILVDDGSTDDTAAQAERALRECPHQIVRHDRNRGIGAALKTGVRAARAPWVTFLPADGQIDPAAIGVLRDEAARSHAEVVFSVYADRNDGLDRKLMSWGVRALVLGVHGVRMQSDGPYLFRRELFLPERLPSDSFFLNFEFPIRVLVDERPTAVVTISCRPRRSGVSKTARPGIVLRVARELLAFRVRRFREALAR